MIVTVTPNPSIDRTVTLAGPLTRGAVHRVTSVTTEAGGKGVNVARALTLAGVDAVALLPAAGDDPLIAALQDIMVPFRIVPTDRAGAHQPGDHRIRRDHHQTQRARRRTRCRRRRRAHAVGGRKRASPRRGWCCRVRYRRACPTAGTPTSWRGSPHTPAESRSTPPTRPWRRSSSRSTAPHPT